MFFTASKLVYFLVAPSNLMIFLGLAGCLLLVATRLRRTGTTLVTAGFLGLAVLGFSPLPNLLMMPLEDRFPEYADDGRPVSGIIVLGGAIETGLSAARRQLVVNDAGERQIAMADLARRYPQARLLFTGGSGSLKETPLSEAEVVSRHADELGLPRSRLILEQRSRNTHENAMFSAAMVLPKPGERWILVTSGWHMPRSVGCFRKAGFEVIAHPVDYRTRGPRDATRFNVWAAEYLLPADLAVKEWLGLLAYRLAGYIDDWMPGPA